MTKKKTVATITRSHKHPRVAYIIIPCVMVPDIPFVDVMVNKAGDIAFKFHHEGSSTANKTSKQSATIRITFPAPVVANLPIGSFDCNLVQSGDLFKVVTLDMGSGI
jgi:hypothetical protein